MLMNRIGPSSAEMYIADADGAGSESSCGTYLRHNACFGQRYGRI